VVLSPWFFGPIVVQSPLLKLNTIIYVCIFVPSQMGDIESISNRTQYVTLNSKIKCLSLAFFFRKPTNKTETRTAYSWGTTNSKPPGPIIVIDESEILSRSQVQVITLFLGGEQLCCAFY
jgi:hypothetical protein